MHLKTVDGVMLHVAELGHGSPVVMLHGLVVGSMMTWYVHGAPRLARHHHVVLFDLRGHGRSDRTATGYDLDTMSRDVDCVLQRFATEPAVVIGHSYGALVALRFASMWPDRVSKLVLVEAPLSHATDVEAFLGLEPDRMVEALPTNVRNSIASGRRRTRFVEAMRFFSTESSIVRDMTRALHVAAGYLSDIRCPVLAVYGTESPCRSSGAQIAAGVSQSMLVELKGGHLLPIEAPEQLGDVLEAFVDG